MRGLVPAVPVLSRSCFLTLLTPSLVRRLWLRTLVLSLSPALAESGRLEAVRGRVRVGFGDGEAARRRAGRGWGGMLMTYLRVRWIEVTELVIALCGCAVGNCL